MAYLRLPESDRRLGDYGWSVRIPLISSEGHEVLTRNAIGPARTIRFTVAGRPMSRLLSPGEVDRIIAGVREVDLGWMGTGLAFSLAKAEQKRHALRYDLGQRGPAALRDIVGSMTSQHAGILAERDPNRRLFKIGQALHLVQDSFSPAHTQRRPGSAWCISYIRNFGRGRAPAEHGTPSDARDQVPRSPTEAAQATAASRRYLEIVFKAIYGLTPPGNPAAVAEAATEFRSLLSSMFNACASGVGP